MKVYEEGDSKLGFRSTVTRNDQDGITFEVIYWGDIYEEMYGDDDLEIWVYIEKNDIKLLDKSLGHSVQNLTNKDIYDRVCNKIAKEFKDEKNFTDWLTKNNIHYETHSY